MTPRTWKCQRQTAGVKCSTVNPARTQVCRVCAKRKPRRKRPAHMRALDLPYEAYIAVNGNGCCGICAKPPKPGKRLHRDHDHRTAKPRGLLCFRCNTVLRPYMDLQWLEAAVAYLRRTETGRSDELQPAERCACGVTSRGLVRGVCADCRDVHRTEAP